MTETVSRPRRRNRVIVEPHDTYSFYLPVEPMERLRRWAEGRGLSYADAMTQALHIFLAAKIGIRDTDRREVGRDL